MRFGIGLITFWITILSIYIFIVKKFKIDKKIAFPMSFTLIGLYEFILGIINQMRLGSWILIFLCIYYLIYLCLNKEIQINSIKSFFKDYNTIPIIGIFIYITIIGFNMHLTHYDSFASWGLIVQSMFKHNMLPNFEHTYIYFKGYQPGSACFIYFFGFLAGKSEGTMIIAQNYLIFAYYSVLFYFIVKKINIVKPLTYLLTICLYIFIMSTSISFNNLLVDTLVAVCFIYLIVIGLVYKDDFNKLLLCSIPVLVYLFLIKNIGLILDGFFCLYILYTYLKSKKFKNAFKYILIVGCVLFFTLLLWQGHVTLAFGKNALESKHSLSFENIGNSLKKLGKDNLILFIKLYFENIFNIKGNMTHIYMICINIVSLILLLLIKNKKELFRFIILLNGIFGLYWFILGSLYILSMPWGEAKIIICYNRYMMTIIIIIYSLFLINLSHLSHFYNNKLYNCYLIFIIILLLTSINYNKSQFNVLLGNDHYKNSKIEKFDSILNDIPKNKNIYYIYSPTSENDCGFLHYLARYKMRKPRVYPVYDLENTKFAYDSYIVLYDDIVDQSKLINYKKINDRVYLVK